MGKCEACGGTNIEETVVHSTLGRLKELIVCLDCDAPPRLGALREGSNTGDIDGTPLDTLVNLEMGIHHRVEREQSYVHATLKLSPEALHRVVYRVQETGQLEVGRAVGRAECEAIADSLVKLAGMIRSDWGAFSEGMSAYSRINMQDGDYNHHVRSVTGIHYEEHLDKPSIEQYYVRPEWPKEEPEE